MYGVLTKFEAREDQNKCPMCRHINEDFMKLDDDQLACYVCGCIFLSRNARERERAGKKEKIEIELRKIVCECGQKCKTKAGLAAHKRHCEKD